MRRYGLTSMAEAQLAAYVVPRVLAGPILEGSEEKGAVTREDITYALGRLLAPAIAHRRGDHLLDETGADLETLATRFTNFYTGGSDNVPT